MEWRERAIVLGVRRHGETSVVAELMTRGRGRHLGLVRGGRSRRQQPVLQPGNHVEATWRARLDEHLGTLSVEPLVQRAAHWMDAPMALNAVQLLAAHLRLLAEREAHPRLYDALEWILDRLHDPMQAAGLVLDFERALLEDLGFGLDLQRCALTGETGGLAYVSPRTGRAVTAEAGRPWKDKLLVLPPSFLDGAAPHPFDDLGPGFQLTGHFLARNLWLPRGLDEPGPRRAFILAVIQGGAGG